MSGSSSLRLDVHRVALRVFGALPRRVRRGLVRLGSPKYTVGAICIVQRDDGAVLLVGHSYNRRWGTPGGLAKRHERPEMACVRETREETGLRVELVGEPVVVVEPVPHRVDVVFLARPAPGEDPSSARPSSAEIERCEWFPLDELPQLQVETVTAMRSLERSGLLDLTGANLP